MADFTEERAIFYATLTPDFLDTFLPAAQKFISASVEYGITTHHSTCFVPSPFFHNSYPGIHPEFLPNRPRPTAKTRKLYLDLLPQHIAKLQTTVFPIFRDFFRKILPEDLIQSLAQKQVFALEQFHIFKNDPLDDTDNSYIFAFTAFHIGSTENSPRTRLSGYGAKGHCSWSRISTPLSPEAVSFLSTTFNRPIQNCARLLELPAFPYFYELFPSTPTTPCFLGLVLERRRHFFLALARLSLPHDLQIVILQFCGLS